VEAIASSLRLNQLYESREAKSNVIEIAQDSGFGEISNFNHAFRAEFGVNPRTYRIARSNSPSFISQQ
jgi:AraC-like DNA-binding protein